MLRCDNRLHDHEVQTDSCLSSTIFASEADVENLTSEFESKLSALGKNLYQNNVHLPFLLTIFLNLYQSPVIHLLKYQSMLSIPHKALRRHIKMKLFQLTNLIRSRQEKLFVGHSLLHRMDVKKMKVSDIHSVKLTKKGDNLTGSMSLCRNRRCETQ